MREVADPFAGGLVVEGGVVTGAWLRDLHGLCDAAAVPPGTCSLLVAGRMGRQPLGHHASAAREALEPPPSMHALVQGLAGDRRPARGFCRFLMFRARMSGIESGEAGSGVAAAFAARCAQVDGDGSLRERGLASIRTALDATQAFVDTLDPFAVRNVDDRMDDETYAAMDAGLSSGAPLAHLVARLPGLRGCAVALWRLDRLDGAVDEAGLVEALRWQLSEDKGPASPAHVAAIRAMAARFEAMPALDRSMARAHCKAEDPARVLGSGILSLPRSWEPRTGPEWVAAARCMAVVRFAMGSSATPDIARLVGGKGRWAEHLASLLAVDLGNDDGGTVTMGPVRDMGSAFGQQVVRPALPDLGRTQAALVAHGLLFSGRCVHRMLGMAREWHERQGAIDAAMQGVRASAGGASTRTDGGWAAGFPDWGHGDVEIRVLTTPGDLASEGARGVDATGRPGLRHCVGTYAPACRRGKVRILGLRGTGPGGATRLSTAEVSTAEGWRVVQHKGWRNGPPPREAETALEAYLHACRDGSLRVDRDGFRPMAGTGGAVDDAGYDATAPGARDAVFEAWGPLLPRGLRRAGLAGLPALADGVPVEDGRWWLPPGDTRRKPAAPVTGP